MAVYTLPTPKPFRPPSADPLELSGEDIMLTNKLEILSGDWRTVSGADAAKQSVIREGCANVGAQLRRPEWGMGVVQSLFHGMTKSQTETMITRVRNRMQRNPRIGRFLGAEVFRLSAARGLAVSIKYEPVGVKQPINTILKGTE